MENQKHKELRHNIQEIKEHFEEIEHILSILTPQERGGLLNAHNDNATIQHCSRWGLNASNEIIDLIYAEKFEVGE